MSHAPRSPSAPPPPPEPSEAATQRSPGWLRAGWERIRDFSGAGGDATYLWPRWLVLRAIGVVYLFVFTGIIGVAAGVIGPRGIVPLDEFFLQVRAAAPNPLAAFLGAPSLFWLGTSPALIAGLAWTGFLAAGALVLNLWPRQALFLCWVVFLSFAATWRVFSPAQLDNLMLEVALVCLPFAPGGFRPGLGANHPPRPLTVFMVRWLLFRVMFEAGIVKLAAGDPHWRNLTAMDVMYETSPFPTIFGYWDHHLPQAYHVGEIILTFVAELLAPVVAVLGGRRGRWFALAAWTALQAGIQLTNNFGWLNTAAIGLGLLLLDDQMIAGALTRLRAGRLAVAATFPPKPSTPHPRAGWKITLLRVGLWTHFAFSLVFLAKACGLPPTAVPGFVARPLAAVSEFRSVNEYSLYAAFEDLRYQVEFEGSNDGGRTWRTYEYRFLPQRTDQIAPFIAPRFARFDATMQIVVWKGRKSPVIAAVARHLLAGTPEVVGLFGRNPFPDRPPTIVRMRGYRYVFTTPATLQRTGNYWHKEYAGDYAPPVHRTESGEEAELSLAEADAAVQNGQLPAAVAMYNRQFQLGNLDAGFRLVDLVTRGVGGRGEPAKALALLQLLSDRGEVGAEHNLGACHEFGIGTPVNYGQAAVHYRRAAERGYLLSRYSLGALYAQDRLQPRDDVAGLALLLEAADRVRGDDPASKYIRSDDPGHRRRLEQRMTAAELREAYAKADVRRR